MKITEHYLQLRKGLPSQKENDPFHITVKELSDLLCCSPRYTKKVINEMKEKQWIDWEVEYGRGKKPTLTLLKNQGELMYSMAKTYFEAGHFKEGLQLLPLLSPYYEKKLNEWLHGSFGYFEETKEDDSVHLLRYPFYHSIIHLDPPLTKSIHENHIVNHLFDTLLVYNEKTNQVEPSLAHYWEVDSSGCMWTFYLRKGVLFHHGRECSADDVVETFQRLHIGNFPNVWMVANIKEIKKIKKWVVQFQLYGPDYLFPHALCHEQLSIVPLDVIKSEPKFTKYPIGTGPYKVTAHDDTLMRLEVHPYYFNGRPFLDKVEIITMPDETEVPNMISYFDVNKQTDDTPMAWQEVEFPEEGATYITFNLWKDGLHQSEFFREALAYAINKEALCDDIEKERYFPAESQLISETNRATGHEYNKEKAKALLAKAGYKGETITLYGTQLRKNASVLREISWLQKEWSNIGVNVKIAVFPIDELIKKDRLQEADIVMGGFAFGHDLVYSFYRLFHLNGAFVRPLLDDELTGELHKRLVEIRQEKERANQLKKLIELEKGLIDRRVVINLFHRRHAVHVKEAALKGVSLERYGRVSYKKLWFK